MYGAGSRFDIWQILFKWRTKKFRRMALTFFPEILQSEIKGHKKKTNADLPKDLYELLKSL